MISIIDTFIYNGEPIAELRLRYLYDVVDRFIVAGATCVYDAHIDVFEPFKDKVTFIAVDVINSSSRNLIQHHIQSVYHGTDYIVMVCDVDEIPSVETVKALPQNYFKFKYPIRLRMKTFVYNFNWIRKEDHTSAVCINDLGIYTTPFQEMRDDPINVCSINNAGWHGRLCFWKNALCELMSLSHDTLRRYLREGVDTDLSNLSRFDILQLPLPFQRFTESIEFAQRYT
jgi:hypothetical protein